MTRLRAWLAANWFAVGLPAAIIYVPLMFTAPGRVGADTKTYLYIDPSRLLADAPYIWHDRIGLGTVTHQNIGYLFPTGPFYWLFDQLGSPDWLAQRLWLGSILFGAALGVRYLWRTVGNPTVAGIWGSVPVVVAMLAYALSPYFLAYAARISVILLPWAALPWLMALTARALRTGGWRYPALFAFTVLVVGGINATALILVAIGPAAWIVYAVVIERSVSVAGAVGAAVRIGVLTLATSAWWIAGLFIQGTHGLPVLRYTETFKTVAESSTAPEVLRGLGYWFFYGNDKLGPWIEPSVTYTTNLGILALSFAVPLVALASAVVVRWRHRGLFALLIMVGGLVAVGGHPWDQGSLLGRLFTGFTRSDAGLALRSTPRAVPLVALGTAMFLGVAAEACRRHLPAMGRPVAARVVPVVLLVAVVANMPPLWTGGLVADNLQRDEQLPGYWLDAAGAIDAGDHRYRVLELPGSDFAAYRWGNTVDPVTPGLTERPWVARELFQYGSAPSANLLNAFDRRLHEDTLDPDAVVPVARLMGVDTLLVRSDLQYERYRIARPRILWEQLTGIAELGEPTPFGPTERNRPEPSQPLVDEIELALDPTLADPPAVALLAVPDPVPITRAVTARNPLVVAGDAEGIVDAAGAGIVSPNQVILSSPWFSGPGDPTVLAEALSSDADLLVTDSNRRRAARWGTLRENNGYTEMAGEQPLTYDPTDQRLEIFGDASDDTRSVTVVQARPGDVVATARATAWGNPVTLTPDDRPMAALDGDPTTAWRVGAVDDPIGERLVIELGDTVQADTVTVLQPTTLSRNRWITTATLHFSDSTNPAAGTTSVPVTFDDASRDAAGGGQNLSVGNQTFDTLAVEITGTNVGRLPRYDGQSGVGLAVVGIEGVSTVELVRTPIDLVERVGNRHGDHRLMYLLTRLRSNPAEPVRGDPETALRRLIDVPGARQFSLSGQARLSAFITDDAVDTLVGLPPANAGGVTATSSERLPGSLRHRASAAIDGNTDTFWSSPFEQFGEVWLDFVSATPVTFDSADLTVLTDGRHSVPTRVRIDVDGPDGGFVTVQTVDIDPVPTTEGDNSTTVLPIDFGTQVTANRVRVVVEELDQVFTTDWYSNAPVVMPVAIADVAIDGLRTPPVADTFTTGCRTDLVAIDGNPVAVEATGTTADAVSRRPLTLAACDAEPVSINAGDQVIEATDGRTTGIDIDQLMLASDAGGGPLLPGALPRELPAGPVVDVDANGRVRTTGSVAADAEPWWLIQGQSWSSGWEAELVGGDGTARTLGEPQLVNGFANGWLVDPPESGPVAMTLEWTPQRVVWLALGLSAVGLIAVAAAVALGRRQRPGDLPVSALPALDWVPWSAKPPVGGDSTPGWAGPLGVGATALVAATAGLVAAVNLPLGTEWVAVGVAALAAVSVRVAAARNLPAVAATATFALSAAFTVVQQFRNRYPADFVWPAEFGRVHVLGVVALLALGVVALGDLIARRRDTAGDPGATQLTETH